MPLLDRVLQTHLRFIKHLNELEMVIGPLREKRNGNPILTVGNPAPPTSH